MKTPRPGKGQLLLKVEAALTCGTDLKAYLRGHPMIPMPGPFGHEFSGVVEAAGKGVTKFQEGDAVMAVHSAPCLRCRYCRKNLHNLCEELAQGMALGAYAEYILLPERIVRQNAYPKPEGLSFEAAALLEPVSCVVHGVDRAHVAPGGTALVIGSGPIGLIHVMLLKQKGAVVAACDRRRPRLRAAKALGADVASEPEGLDRAVRKLTGNLGFDFVFECTGRAEVWEAGVNYLRRGGVLVLFGGCPPGTRVSYPARRLHYDELTLRGFFHYTPEDVRRAFGFLARESLPWAELISGSYPLRRIGKAFERLSEGKGIKYAIVP